MVETKYLKQGQKKEAHYHASFLSYPVVIFQGSLILQHS